MTNATTCDIITAQLKIGEIIMAEKSALYPQVTWNDCLDFAKTVSSFNLKAVSYLEVAKKYGLTSPTAKSFTSKISSCKQYGLISTFSGNTIQITDTCKRILFPTGENTQEIIRSCFSMPPLYSKLIALYDGKAIPNVNLLANILMNDHKIQKSVKDTAAKAFIESAEQLGFIKGGILCYSEELNSADFESCEDKSDATITEEITDNSNSLNNSQYISPMHTNNEADYITQTIPFESGKIARVVIPIDATEDDLLFLNDMIKVILNRKFKFET